MSNPIFAPDEIAEIARIKRDNNWTNQELAAYLQGKNMEQAKGNDMNEAERNAMLAAEERYTSNLEPSEIGYAPLDFKAGWQAALEWRDSQVGEAVGWIQFADGKQTQNFCRGKEEIQTIDSLSRLMNKNSDISYQPVFLFSHDSVSAEKAWERGYKSGVEDERMSEANIGIAGLVGKINPARENPYRNGTTPPTAQINEQMREALQDLIDVQNGPPLLKYKKEWEDAMAKAGTALIAAKSATPK